MNEKLANIQKAIDLPAGIPPLLTYYLYVTNSCNLACRHCWITPSFVDGTTSPRDYIELKLLKHAVFEGKKLGLTGAKLTGGEPVIHPQFLEIVDFLSENNIRLVMETNATLIDVKMAKHLKDNTTMWHISASLDGARSESHDQFRCLPGAFQMAIEGIKNLVQVGFKPQIIMCPHRGNINEINDLVKLAVTIGAGSVKFNPVTPTGRGVDMEKNGEILTYEQTMNLVRYIRGELQDRTSIPLYISVPPALSSIKTILRERNAGGSCNVINIMGILGNGEMALCGIGKNTPELCFGRLGKDALRDVWINNATLINLRNALKAKFSGICNDCIHDRRCLTMCVAMNFVRTGALISPDYLCAEAACKGEFPATRRKSYTNMIHV